MQRSISWPTPCARRCPIRETAQAVISAVEQAGYHAALPGPKPAPKDRNPQAQALKEMKTRIIWSALFLVILMYFTMGHMVGLPLPHGLHGKENALTFALLQFFLTLPVVLLNHSYYSRGFKALWRRSPNMDSLIAVGSGAALVYGVAALFRMAWATGHGVWDLVEHYRENLYFESAAMILTLITLGKFLETRAKGQDRRRHSHSLWTWRPQTGHGGAGRAGEWKSPRPRSRQGDISRGAGPVGPDSRWTAPSWRAGPSVDQSALTGESVPVAKRAPATRPSAAAISKHRRIPEISGRTKVGEDTTLSQIIRLVEEAGGSKAPIAPLGRSGSARRVCPGGHASSP